MAYIYDAPIPYNVGQSYDFAAAWGNTGVSQTYLPHLDAAMVLGSDGTFLTWQQNTIDEVAQSVEVVCGTTIGDRTVVPTFGLPQLPFTIQSSNQFQQAIQQAILTWEPRASTQVIVTIDDAGAQPTITVNTSLRQGSTAS